MDSLVVSVDAIIIKGVFVNLMEASSAVVCKAS